MAEPQRGDSWLGSRRELLQEWGGICALVAVAAGLRGLQWREEAQQRHRVEQLPVYLDRSSIANRYQPTKLARDFSTTNHNVHPRTPGVLIVARSYYVEPVQRRVEALLHRPTNPDYVAVQDVMIYKPSPGIDLPLARNLEALMRVGAFLCECEQQGTCLEVATAKPRLIALAQVARWFAEQPGHAEMMFLEPVLQRTEAALAYSRAAVGSKEILSPTERRLLSEDLSALKEYVETLGQKMSSLARRQLQIDNLPLTQITDLGPEAYQRLGMQRAVAEMALGVREKVITERVISAYLSAADQGKDLVVFVEPERATSLFQNLTLTFALSGANGPSVRLIDTLLNEGISTENSREVTGASYVRAMMTLQGDIPPLFPYARSLFTP